MSATTTNLTKSQLLLLELVEKLGGEVDDKIKLAKLQYFSDFIHQAFNDVPISDSDNFYQRREYGPLLRTFNDDLKVLCDTGLLKQKGAYHYQVGKTIQNKGFSPKEEKTMDFVVSRYGRSSWKELCRISHSQIPFLSASGDGAVIEYFTAYNLVDEYPEYADFATS